MRLGHLKYVSEKVSVGLGWWVGYRPVGGRVWCRCSQVGPKKNPNIFFWGSPGAEKAPKKSQIVLTTLDLAS
jgi:hypothetical protein